LEEREVTQRGTIEATTVTLVDDHSRQHPGCRSLDLRGAVHGRAEVALIKTLVAKNVSQ
jgi:hypothetical protein